jgi:vacuolar-type H+-ATPase subunit H
MNEVHIQEVIKIERQAEELLESGKREADSLRVQAQAEAQERIRKARLSAEAEARTLVERAQAGEEVEKIQSAAQARMQQAEALAARNSDLAVAYVLERVIGKA